MLNARKTNLYVFKFGPQQIKCPYNILPFELYLRNGLKSEFFSRGTTRKDPWGYSFGWRVILLASFMLLRILI